MVLTFLVNLFLSIFAHHVFAIYLPQVIFIQADITDQPLLSQYPLGAFLYTTCILAGGYSLILCPLYSILLYHWISICTFIFYVAWPQCTSEKSSQHMIPFRAQNYAKMTVMKLFKNSLSISKFTRKRASCSRRCSPTTGEETQK